MEDEEEEDAAVEDLSGFSYRPPRQSYLSRKISNNEKLHEKLSFDPNTSIPHKKLSFDPTRSAGILPHKKLSFDPSTSSASFDPTGSVGILQHKKLSFDPSGNGIPPPKKLTLDPIPPHEKLSSISGSSIAQPNSFEASSPRAEAKLSPKSKSILKQTSSKISRQNEEPDKQQQEKQQHQLKADKQDENRFNIQLIYHLMSNEHYREHNSWQERVWKRLLLLMVLVASAGFLMCISVLAIFIHLHPVTPDARLGFLRSNTLQITPVDSDTIIAQQQSGDYYGYICFYNFDFSISINNTNPKVDVIVEYIQATLQYKGYKLGIYEKQDLFIPLKSSTGVNGSFLNVLDGVHLPLNAGYAFYQDAYYGSTVIFIVDILFRGRISTIGGMKSSPFYTRTRCSTDTLWLDYNTPKPVECIRML